MIGVNKGLVGIVTRTQDLIYLHGDLGQLNVIDLYVKTVLYVFLAVIDRIVYRLAVKLFNGKVNLIIAVTAATLHRKKVYLLSAEIKVLRKTVRFIYYRVFGICIGRSGVICGPGGTVSTLLYVTAGAGNERDNQDHRKKGA